MVDINKKFVEKILASFPAFAEDEINSNLYDLPYVIIGNFAVYLNTKRNHKISCGEVDYVFNQGIEEFGAGISNLIIVGFLEVLNDNKENIAELKNKATGELKKLISE